MRVRRCVGNENCRLDVRQVSFDVQRRLYRRIEREALQIGELAHIIPQPYQKEKSSRPAMSVANFLAEIVPSRQAPEPGGARWVASQVCGAAASSRSPLLSESVLLSRQTEIDLVTTSAILKRTIEGTPQQESKSWQGKLSHACRVRFVLSRER